MAKETSKVAMGLILVKIAKYFPLAVLTENGCFHCFGNFRCHFENPRYLEIAQNSWPFWKQSKAFA